MRPTIAALWSRHRIPSAEARITEPARRVAGSRLVDAALGYRAIAEYRIATNALTTTPSPKITITHVSTVGLGAAWGDPHRAQKRA